MNWETWHEDAHHHAAHVQEKKTKNLPSFSNPFHNYTKSKQRSKLVDASPISDDDAAAEASPVIIGSRGRGGEDNRKTTNSKTSSINLIGRASSKKDFVKRTALGTGTQHSFHDPHSLPSLDLAFQSFKQVYPRFEETVAVDFLRDREYHGQCLLAAEEENGHVVLDYCGFGLFSQWQQVMEQESSSFELDYISANLPTHALYGCSDDGSLECYIRKRVMRYMNVNQAEYSMVFTMSVESAFKLLAESYPFPINNRLLTVYDYESEAVNGMVASARDKGAKIMTASFKWPSLRIVASDLKYKLRDKKKKKEQQAKGLFVFPVQSRFTGAKYSYQWMSQAQANKWHVLLDASALGPKDMDSLGLSLFRPEFIVTSFYKVFGIDRTGFGCLFIKNSVIQSLQTSSRARGVGMVRIVPSELSNSNSLTFSDGKAEGEDREGNDKRESKNSHTLAQENMEMDEIEEFLDAEDWSSPGGNHVDSVSSEQDSASQLRHASFLDRLSAGGSANSGVNSEIGSVAGSHDNEIATNIQPELEDKEEEVRDQGHDASVSLMRQVLPTPTKAVAGQADDYAFEEHHLSELITSSPITVGSNTGEDNSIEQERQFNLHEEDFTLHQGFHPSLSRIGEEEDIVNGDEVTSFHMQSEIEEDTPDESTSDLGSSVIRKGDEEHFLMEGREAGSFSKHRRILSSLEWNFDGEAELDFSEREAYDGTNGRRFQYWSPGEESNKWAEPYAISTNGSPLYYEEEGGVSVEESEPEMLDDNNGVTCSGLDHADSQGLNKITRRLRYLTNWVISALLKLHHPAQVEGQGTPLVHIYGPEVQFDRGASFAFNILDQNGVVVQPKLVQQLADQSNISLGLGKLCNIIYPEGLRGFRGLHLTEKTVAPGGKTDGMFENPRASNANKGDRALSIPVVTAALGFVTNFEDVYRLWAFVAKFLDVNFVSERGELETAVPLSFNQKTVVL
ncbi:unnamed protein product [Sphagnum troendelagicum]|uniref:Molybdenum cofactor sulfurase n=1 Tax=Sphagnum troendelagicum TaxID=128251 RepID=A0ABP0UWX7_9BRYO